MKQRLIELNAHGKLRAKTTVFGCARAYVRLRFMLYVLRSSVVYAAFLCSWESSILSLSALSHQSVVQCICDVNDLVKLKMLSKDIHYCCCWWRRVRENVEYANKLCMKAFSHFFFLSMQELCTHEYDRDGRNGKNIIFALKPAWVEEQRAQACLKLLKTTRFLSKWGIWNGNHIKSHHTQSFRGLSDVTGARRKPSKSRELGNISRLIWIKLLEKITIKKHYLWLVD